MYAVDMVSTLYMSIHELNASEKKNKTKLNARVNPVIDQHPAFSGTQN